MGRIINTASLSKLAKKKVKAAGYSLSTGEKTSSKSSSKSSTAKRKEEAKKSAAEIREAAFAGAARQSGITIPEVRPEDITTDPATGLGISQAQTVPKYEISQPPQSVDMYKVQELALQQTQPSFEKSGYTGEWGSKISTPEEIATAKAEFIDKVISGVGRFINWTQTPVPGAEGVSTGIPAFAFIAPTRATAVAKLATVGTEGIVASITTTAEGFAVNAATEAKTLSWLAKLANQVKDPKFVAGSIMAAIGSYPFSGFIKEEALQTLGFAISSALNNGNIAGAEAAIELQEEVLDPTLWDKIFESIPFVNVLKNLKDFYESAKIKLAIDKQYVQDLKTKSEKGETTQEYWKRINNQQDEQEKALIDYYNQQRMLLVEWERQAQIQARNEDAKFWAEQQKKQREIEEKERQAIADFWFQYRKRILEIQEDSRPSNLNFGLL